MMKYLIGCLVFLALVTGCSSLNFAERSQNPACAEIDRRIVSAIDDELRSFAKESEFCAYNNYTWVDDKAFKRVWGRIKQDHNRFVDCMFTKEEQENNQYAIQDWLSYVRRNTRAYVFEWVRVAYPKICN